VDVWLGDGADSAKLSEVARSLGQIDFLFLDGVPKETRAYLEAALPHLAPGAMVVADNTGVFGEGGMRPYLEVVRGGGDWSSGRVAATLEWRPDVADAMEVSVYKGNGGAGEAAAAAEAAQAAAAAVAGGSAGAGAGAAGGVRAGAGGS
jgi:predicted O-methyltransferase YrrM